MSNDSRTWLDLARDVAAEFGLTPSDNELDHVLWEWTCFPFGDPQQVEQNLREYFTDPEAVEERVYSLLTIHDVGVEGQNS